MPLSANYHRQNRWHVDCRASHCCEGQRLLCLTKLPQMQKLPMQQFLKALA